MPSMIGKIRDTVSALRQRGGCTNRVEQRVGAVGKTEVQKMLDAHL
jgi:hypothetical protein